MEKGIWIKYSDPSEASKLASMVSGVEAYWKIKNEENAKYFLTDGIVYVYYTEDQNGNYTIPRLNIITNKQGRVGLAWGIAQGENIEDSMLDVLDDKLDEINDKKFLHKPRVADLKLLEQIYNKTMKGVELTVDEIRFLYEFDRKIKNFGFSQDNRVAILRKTRDASADMNRAFRAMDDYEGDLVINIPTYVKGLVFPKRVSGNFELKKATSLSDCVLPETVGGSIELPKVKKMNGVLFGETIGKDVVIRYLTQTDYVIFPRYVAGSFLADNLRKAKNTIFPEKVWGRTALISLEQSHGNKTSVYGAGSMGSPYNPMNQSASEYQEIMAHILEKLPEEFPDNENKHVM